VTTKAVISLTKKIKFNTKLSELDNWMTKLVGD
jgi:hypothetical protein